MKMTLEFKTDLENMVKAYPRNMVKGVRQHPKNIMLTLTRLKLLYTYEQQIPVFEKSAETEADVDKKAMLLKRLGEIKDMLHEIPALVDKSNRLLEEHKRLETKKKKLARKKKKGHNKKRTGFNPKKKLVIKNLKL